MPPFENFLSKLFGSSNQRKLKKYQPLVAEINALEPELEKLSDADLRARTERFKKEVADGKDLDDLLVPAFATVREAAKRTLGLRHFDVQLIGGMVLHKGGIAEMQGLLRELGERFPTRPSGFHVARELLATRLAIRGMEPEDFLTAPRLEDELVRALADLLLDNKEPSL